MIESNRKRTLVHKGPLLRFHVSFFWTVYETSSEIRR